MGKYPVGAEKELGLSKEMGRLGIDEQDIVEKFVRGSGPGGQKINKTASTVYLRHEPTGTEVKCQQTRSQALNRYYARKELCSKIGEQILGEQSAKRQASEKVRRQKRKRSKRQKEKMLNEKKTMGQKKKNRRRVDAD